MRRSMSLAMILLGAGCLTPSEPRGFIFQYQIGAYGCSTDCSAPGPAAISAASLGDTVWVLHTLTLLGAPDSLKPQTARLRPDCAENVALLLGSATAGTLPSAQACPDSTYAQDFSLKGITAPTQINRYSVWIVDSSHATGGYGLRGRVMVDPRLEPVYLLTVQ